MFIMRFFVVERAVQTARFSYFTEEKYKGGNEMEESGETLSTLEEEDIFSRVKRIFDEKEVEFRNWERELNQKELQWEAYSASLHQLKDQLEQSRQKMEGKYGDLEKREAAVIEREKQIETQQKTMEETLLSRSAILDEKEKKLNQRLADVSKKESEMLLEKRIETENLNNEKLKIKREWKAVEAERAKMGMGICHQESNSENYISRDVVHEEYISRAEVSEKVDEYEKCITELQELNEILKKRMEALEQEKAELFRKLIATNVSSKNQRELAADEMISIPVDETSEQSEGINETTDKADEELTADVLAASLKKNNMFEKVEILHAKEGVQISAQKGLLHYRFVFNEPPYFDVYIERDVDEKRKKVIDQFRVNHPELEITTENGMIRITGYFTKDMSTWNLLDNVNRATDCLNQGE